MIEETLTYYLLKAMKRGRAAVLPVLTEHGLHQGQELLLSRLWQEDGITQRELIARLGVEAPTVTKALQRLERSGFVRREPAGGRRRRVYLTDAGRGLREPVEEAWRQADEATLEGLTPSERADLERLLRRVADLYISRLK